MAQTDLIDFFDIEVLLEPEEIDLRNRVRRFVNEVCMPVIAGHFDKGTFPLNVIAPLHSGTLRQRAAGLVFGSEFTCHVPDLCFRI